ncbi:bifunctional lysylphosphatidylglycerol flippase/synthetase MprF [Asticcacaulis sp. 201]|uniref:bifunctional lysylphosphatidylglycerol flippase/synthetase MprF n=1 Tax=Asticcacaulis sp. 201 TaxID=3028787 RepID=UPI002916C3CF|nr:bifunctional lysylphosphatidylglycerol flippase/synthetase MprF [Asticcacaulis sp. 201]MDV6329869.1 bifunctional lysylphosphatidylglycerol flippase/synthetase MprF [Asticcacaulis sp. 201]
MAEIADTMQTEVPEHHGRWPKWIPGLIGCVLFALAAYFIAREVRNIHWRDVEAAVSGTSPWNFALAIAALSAGLLAASTFDSLSMAGLGKPAPWRTTWLTSITAFILGNTGGLGIALAGGARYRAYSGLGFSASDIMMVSAVTAVCGIFGGFGLLGLNVANSLSDEVMAIHMPHIVGVIISLVGVQVLALYLLTPRVGPLSRFLPSRPVRAGQIVASTWEWTAAATVLYAFLPDETRGSLLHLLPVFALAGLLGAVSGLPGGVGPFDAVILATLSRRMGSAEVVSALLLYRLTYVLLPIAAVAAVESVKLLRPHRKAINDTARVGTEAWLALAPIVFGVLTFASGLIMLASVVTPDAAERLKLLSVFVPAGLVEISHFIASLTGVALLFLGVGVHSRMKRAYVATLVVLIVAAFATLAKGLNYEEAVILLGVAGLMYLSRDAFYRQTKLRAGPLSPATILAIFSAVAAAAWLGFFAHKHVAYSQELWWTFLTDQTAPRFLRALVGISALALIVLVWRLTNPEPEPAARPTEADLAHADRVWQRAEGASTDGNLAFLGDKSLLFSESGDSFIQYMSRGATWVTMGEPVGKRSEFKAMIWAFRELCDRHGAKPVFYAVRRETIPDFVDCGLVASKIGENALVDLRDFNLNGASRASLRHAFNRGNRDGLVFEIIPADAFATVSAELRAVSDSWLSFHHGSEKGFSLGRFDEAYLARFPTAVLKREGRIVAFSNLWSTPDHRILSIDLMRYDAHAPKNAMDFLFINLMLWGKENGYADFDLGMAPLAGLENHHLARSINQLGTFIFNRGEDLYGFQGLRAFKEKFSPRWEGSYIAAPTGWLLVPALADAALLSSGGVRGLLKMA